MIELKCEHCDKDYVATTELIMSEDVIECKVCLNVILICDDELKMQINEVFNV
jgi:DNA-directed RNA polymerase subunit RPC12/RpoP